MAFSVLALKIWVLFVPCFWLRLDTGDLCMRESPIGVKREKQKHQIEKYVSVGNIAVNKYLPFLGSYHLFFANTITEYRSQDLRIQYYRTATEYSSWLVKARSFGWLKRHMLITLWFLFSLRRIIFGRLKAFCCQLPISSAQTYQKLVLRNSHAKSFMFSFPPLSMIYSFFCSFLIINLQNS